MRLGTWAVAAVGFVILSASGCLTSQDNPSDGGGIEDPPVSTSGRGGSSGSTSQGGAGGEDTGGSAGKGGSSAGRGGSSGTSGSGNAGSGGNADCSEDGDCEARADGRLICSVPTGDCVECLSVDDCEADAECVNNVCKPFTTCATTDDCSRGLVCNPATDRCVECVGSSGCATGDVCVSNTCHTSCTSDSQCILLGLRCDPRVDYCVSCVSNADCPETQNCQEGSCVRDICVGGSASCDENSLTTCNAAGSQLEYSVPCGSQYSCTEDDDGARCEPWICTPGTTGCSLNNDDRVVTCSDDGLSETLEEDCAAADQRCIGGVCSDAVCEPNVRFCAGNTVQLCDSTGTTSSLYQTCATNQLCNPLTVPVTCAVPLCTPNQPTCDGNVYTTCNAQGFGYTGTRTDCSASDQFCGASGCTTSAVDTIPATPTLYSSALGNYMMLNVYSVTGSRTLSRIEQYMSPTSAVTLTWHVFESLTQTGTYTSISNTATTSTTGAGYQSSGALAVPLVAGRFYAIGLSWTTAVLFGYQTTTASQTVSFGALVSGSVQTPIPTATSLTLPMQSSNFVPQRLTTAP